MANKISDKGVAIEIREGCGHEFGLLCVSVCVHVHIYMGAPQLISPRIIVPTKTDPLVGWGGVGYPLILVPQCDVRLCKAEEGPSLKRIRV